MLVGLVLMGPVPPFFADEHGDVTVFDSVRDAELFVEPVDVENGEYRFYDATGLVLRGDVVKETPKDGRIRRLLSTPQLRVRIVAPSEPDRRPDELAEVLRGFLARVGADRTRIADDRLADMTIDHLVAATAEFSRSESKVRGQRGGGDPPLDG